MAYLKILGKVPDDVFVAVSGGADSMAGLDFLNRRKRVTALYFNHGTSFGDNSESFLKNYCSENEIRLIVGRINSTSIPSGVSTEEYWRNERYSFFKNKASGSSLVTCHHLDDVIETWIFSSLNGKSKTIPYKTMFGSTSVIRPFLLCNRSSMEDWCKRMQVPYLNDPSNLNIKFMRNYIRKEVVPRALHVNKGLHKTIRKKVVSEYSSYC